MVIRRRSPYTIEDIKPCAGTCERQTRPSHMRREEADRVAGFPTVTRLSGTLCASCYRNEDPERRKPQHVTGPVDAAAEDHRILLTVQALQRYQQNRALVKARQRQASRDARALAWRNGVGV